MAEARRGWADLPTDIGTSIAERLVLIDLLRFRKVCKSWNSAYAASSCSAKIESSPNYEPWFILYGEESQCILLKGSQKKYKINFPELDGATCIASRDGWLLVRQETVIFFFCPFSRSKIVLPRFPDSEQRDYIGAFSSPPTSKDCVVCVVRRNDKLEVELQLLYRGANAWTMHKYSYNRDFFNNIKAAAYLDDRKRFHIYDDINGFLTFSPEDGNWKIYSIIDIGISRYKSAEVERIPFFFSRWSFQMRSMKTKLGLKEDVSIDTCGTPASYRTDNHIQYILLFNENISQKTETRSRRGRRLKGVWIEPRFHKIPQKCSRHDL